MEQGVVATSDLCPTLNEVASNKCTGQSVKIISLPTVVKGRRSNDERRISDSTRHHNLGAAT